MTRGRRRPMAATCQSRSSPHSTEGHIIQMRIVGLLSEFQHSAPKGKHTTPKFVQWFISTKWC